MDQTNPENAGRDGYTLPKGAHNGVSEETVELIESPAEETIPSVEVAEAPIETSE